MIDLIKMKE